MRQNPARGRQPSSGRGGSFTGGIGDLFGTTTVRVVKNPGTEDETSFLAEAMIQAKNASFDVDTAIYDGDYVEVPDPRKGPDGVELRYVEEATVLNSGPEEMHRVRVTWGKAPSTTPRVAPVRRLTFENLHPSVQSVSGDLFADGHYESAVHEAFKSIEVRVRSIVGGERAGAQLMGDAFKADGSELDVASHDGRSGQDEREGFMHIFRGAVIGIRNPGAHELVQPGDVQQALEYLGFASLLHRRIDAAEAKRP